MNIAEISKNLYDELNKPKGFCPEYIKNKLIKNINKLNKLLEEDFILDKNNELDISLDAISIFKKLYLCEYYKNKSELVKKMVVDNDSKAKCNRMEISKTYKIMEKQTFEEIQVLANNYKRKRNV